MLPWTCPGRDSRSGEVHLKKTSRRRFYDFEKKKKLFVHFFEEKNKLFGHFFEKKNYLYTFLKKKKLFGHFFEEKNKLFGHFLICAKCVALNHGVGHDFYLPVFFWLSRCHSFLFKSLLKDDNFETSSVCIKLSKVVTGQGKGTVCNF
jgi:hypothetical protein